MLVIFKHEQLSLSTEVQLLLTTGVGFCEDELVKLQQEQEMLEVAEVALTLSHFLHWVALTSLVVTAPLPLVQVQESLQGLVAFPVETLEQLQFELTTGHYSSTLGGGTQHP